jgi:RHS repeat-associated protein
VDTLAMSTTQPDGTHWVYRRASDDSTWQFAGGRVTSITRRNGWVLTFSYNGSQLTQVRNAFGRTLNFAYTPTGQLASITTPDGKLISYNADAQGRVARVTYADGTSKSYLYEDSRWPQALTTIVDERGVRFASFTYDAQGRGTSTEHAGGVERYQVSYGANQSALSSPLGAQYQYGYTAQGGALAVASANATRGLGSREAAQRIQNPDGTIASETDFLGVVNAYTWDSAKRPIAATRAAGRPEAQTINTQWHPTLRLPLLVTEAGRTTAYSYDAAGNKLSETTTDTATAQARTWAWTYNAQGLADTMTDPKGGVWKYSYDTAGNRTSVANPLGQQSSFSYDAAGRVTSQTAPNGLATSYSYDMRGRLTQVNRGGETSNYSYTPFGLMASATLPNGYAVSYSYDDAHRLIAATDSRGNTVQYTLDAAGNRVREETKDAGGNIALVTSRIVNNLNQLAAIQGATGQTTQLAYDANGEATAQTDPLNQTTRQTLDALRRTTATTFADNASATQSYNQLDQLTAVNDPKGVKTSYQTNAFGEVMSETSPDIGTLKYERDALGDVTKKTDAKGNVTTITRDALGRPTSIQYAADHIVNYTYDSNSRISGNQTGYLSRIEDKSGTTTYERDAQGRITAKTQTVNDNPRSPSRYTTSYSYTAGDLASITYPSGLKVIYRRNASGQIVGIDTVANSFLKIFRPAQPFVSNLTYTALQQPKSWTWASGDSASRSFDADGRMTANEFASYTYDAASRITGITQNLWASGIVNGKQTLFTTPLTWSAGYDNRNRLTSFDRPGASTSYTYDANSNRLTSQDTRTSDTDLDLDFAKPDMSQATTQALNVDATSNRLMGFSQRVTTHQASRADAVTSATINYSLDENGAMTSDGLRSFEYDAAERMSKVRLMKAGEAASVTYSHNALGQRVFKSEVTADQKLPGAKTLGAGFVAWLKANFQWMYAQAQADASVGTAYSYADGQLPKWALVGEYDNGSASGAGRTEYIWLPTDSGAIPIGLYRGGKFYALHSDHLGTPRVMTNETNAPVWQWPYSAFASNKPTGVLRATAKPGQAITNQPVLLKAATAVEMNLGMPGQYSDAETGDFDNYFRTYDGRTGRYIQADPIGMNGGSNRFGYGGGNPVMFTDPFGLDKQFYGGVSGTLFVGFFGGGGGTNVGISTDGTVAGTSVFVQGQGNLMVGVGGFAGVGGALGTASTDGPLTSGVSRAGYGEIDFGYGPAYSGSASYDGSGGGLGGAGPIKATPGAGIGVALGVGITQSNTWVSPTVRDVLRLLKTKFGKVCK